MPINLTSPTWTATQTGGASGYSPTGSGNINDTAASLPAGSTITYTVTGTVSPTATGTLLNTVNVTPANGAPVFANDDDQMVDLSVTRMAQCAGGSSITPAARPRRSPDEAPHLYDRCLQQYGQAAAQPGLPSPISFRPDFDRRGVTAYQTGSAQRLS